MEDKNLKPIAVQLYTVREALQKDFAGTLERIAAMGYLAVEPHADFAAGMPLSRAADTLQSLGLAVCANHSPLPLGEDKTRVLETTLGLGSPHLVSPWMDPALYASLEGVRELAERFNLAYEVCRENGLAFSIHNHDFEFRPLGEAPAIEALKAHLHPGVQFELDMYWIHVAGQDPAETVAAFGARAPLLHVKDGPGVKEADMTAVGQGVLDVAGIIKAGGDYTEWLIVELDRCGTDMLEALENSYRFMAANGLARGRV